MSTKRGVSAFSLLAVLAMLFAFPLTAFAAGPATVNSVTECVPVGNVVYDFITYDNGMGGLWATDYFHSVVSICQFGEDLYRVTFFDGGSFVTLDANSPGGGGHVAAGIEGVITGGISLVIEGELEDPLPSHVGTIDFRHIPHDYEAPFFDGEYEIVDYLSWGWSYASCGNGTWIDNDETEAAYAAEGPNDLMGDVIGEPIACPTQDKSPVVLNLWAFVNPTAAVGPTNICYLLSSGQPFLDAPDTTADVRGRCFTEVAPDWWQNAVPLTHGDVFENGTPKGSWEGDAIAAAFSGAPRLPLHAPGPNNDLADKADMFPWTQQ